MKRLLDEQLQQHSVGLIGFEINIIVYLDEFDSSENDDQSDIIDRTYHRLCDYIKKLENDKVNLFIAFYDRNIISDSKCRRDKSFA